jgi:hypothetical protein
MGPTRDARPLSRVDGTGTETSDVDGPHEALFEQAMARIATLTEVWGAIRDGLVAPARVPSSDGGVTELVLAAAPATVDALTARSEAPRWRRSLAG